MIRRLWSLSIRVVLMLSVGMLITGGTVLAMRFPTVGWLVLAALILSQARRQWRLSTAFGSARFSGLTDLLRGGLLPEDGLILGKLAYLDRPSRGGAIRSLFSPFVRAEWACRMFFIAFLGNRWVGDVFIRVRNFTHLLTVAPTGAGKSVHTLIPILLSYRGNCVVIDPKGELYSKTAAHRRKRFRHRTVRLDPAGVCGPGSQHLNPLDFIIGESLGLAGDCQDLANMIVTRTGKEQDPHWAQSAENAISAMAAYVCAIEGNRDYRNLAGVRGLLSSPGSFDAAREHMKTIDGFGGVLQTHGEKLSWHVERELGSVMSTVQEKSSFLDDPMIIESTRFTDWNPKLLRTGQGMTVYLIVPTDKLVVWAGLQRLWLGTLLRLVTRGTPNEQFPVLFLVDECGHIGQMTVLENAITVLRGAGVRIWLFFQSLDQLNKCFGENAPTVLDNLGTQQYFGINSYETAKALSERFGHTTVAVESQGSSAGSSWPSSTSLNNPRTRNTGTSFNISETGRPLLMPEEILTMSDDAVLIVHKNLPVVLAGRIRYFADRAFRRGGTGRSRGLGLRGALAAIATLAIAGLLTLGCFGLADTPEKEPAPVAPIPTDRDRLDRPAVTPFMPTGPGLSRQQFSPGNRRTRPPGLRGPSPIWGLDRGEGN